MRVNEAGGFIDVMVAEATADIAGNPARHGRSFVIDAHTGRGPCYNCRHLLCAVLREIAARPCAGHCGRSVGYGNPFEPLGGGLVMHVRCKGRL